MKFIRPCPNCKVELRFPIDLGTVRVTCPSCSFSFLADPDNSDLYTVGNFDLTNTKKSSYKQFLNLDKPLLIKYLIPIFLFLLLFFNILKDCNSDTKTEINIPKENPPPNQEIRTPQNNSNEI